MNIFNIFKSKTKADDNYGYAPSTRLLRMGSEYLPFITGAKEHYNMNLSAVFRAVDLISSTVASLPVNVYKIDDHGVKRLFREHQSTYLLSKEPNPLMHRYTFIKCLVINMLLKGNGYAIIQRDDRGEVTRMDIVDPDMITVLYDESTRSVNYQDVTIGKRYEPCDIIHIMNVPDSKGIIGRSTLEYARQTLNICREAENMAGNFFSNSALSGYLKIRTSGRSTREQKEDARKSWKHQLSNLSIAGVPVLDESQDFIPLTVKDEDIQLLQSRKFNIESIARFFNVSPILLYDLTKNSYASSEHASLQLLNDCIAPLLEKIELEFERKIYLPSIRASIDVKFNESAMLRLDQTSRSEYFTKLYNIGVLSPNEIRNELNLAPIKGGDIHVIQVNTIDITTINNTDK